MTIRQVTYITRLQIAWPGNILNKNIFNIIWDVIINFEGSLSFLYCKNLRHFKKYNIVNVIICQLSYSYDC